jgi:hypothetical protein
MRKAIPFLIPLRIDAQDVFRRHRHKLFATPPEGVLRSPTPRRIIGAGLQSIDDEGHLLDIRDDLESHEPQILLIEVTVTVPIFQHIGRRSLHNRH